jgi:hypothetical protein
MSGKSAMAVVSLRQRPRANTIDLLPMLQFASDLKFYYLLCYVSRPIQS